MFSKRDVAGSFGLYNLAIRLCHLRSRHIHAIEKRQFFVLNTLEHIRLAQACTELKMSLLKFNTKSILVVAVVSAVGGSAFAETDMCSEGVVYTTDAGREVTFVDAAPDGVSIGDKRIGKKDILDADGLKVGVFRWVATVVQLGDGDSKPVYTVDKSYEFGDGILFGRSLDNVNSPVGDTSKVSIVSGHTNIHGGVGKYSGVSGVKHHERHSETGRFTYRFDIECN